MKQLKQWWNRIPSLFTLYTDALQRARNKTLAKFVFFLGVIIWLFIASLITALLNSSYYLAGIGLIISCIMSIGFFILITRETFDNKKVTYVIRGIGVISIIFQLGLTIWSFVPTASMQPDSLGLKPDTTYVTYDPTCPYCQKAKTNMRKAVTRYNNTHSKPLQVVDLTQNTQLTKYIVQHIKYKGSVVTYTADKKFKSPTVYTMGNKNGPLTPSTTEIYNAIINSQHQKTASALIDHQMRSTMKMMVDMGHPIIP